LGKNAPPRLTPLFGKTKEILHEDNDQQSQHHKKKDYLLMKHTTLCIFLGVTLSLLY
jgi:hypothetical protein